MWSRTCPVDASFISLCGAALVSNYTFVFKENHFIVKASSLTVGFACANLLRFKQTKEISLCLTMILKLFFSLRLPSMVCLLSP